MPLTIGENVGPYRIIEQLGQGGMATVYKAYHAALDRYVAIKVMHPAFLEDKNFHARFQREARLVAKLEHPNIVPVHDYAEHESRPYLVMKFIEGETLKARLEAGPLHPEETLRIVETVGAALAYAHSQGVLHRDIKPSNVILARDGRIYLADFGLARIAQSGQSTLTSDMILGTPQYISPEQARGSKDLDEGTDIYSFGVMIYEVTVGRVPFSADTPYSVIHDHIYSALPMPRDVNPAVHPEVERFLLKSLSKDRADRYADVPAQVAAFKSAWRESMAASAAETVGASRDSLPTVFVAPPPGPAPAGGAETQVGAPAPAVAAASTVSAAPVPGDQTEGPSMVPGPVEKKKPRPWLAAIGGLLLLLILGALAFAIVRRDLRLQARRTDAASDTVPAQPHTTLAFSPSISPSEGSASPTSATNAVALVTNLALGKPVIVSSALPSNPPEMAVDGISAADQPSLWGAGDFAPQWIEIDLQNPATISTIRLHISQSPEGETVHRVLGRGASEEFRLLHELNGVTRDAQVLALIPDTPLTGIQFIRIETVESPSWVGWREIEIFGTAESSVAETSPAPVGVADIIYTNGQIITMEAGRPSASALAISGDKIIAVGGDADVLKLRGQATKVVDLQGQAVLPGFIDSHTHRIGDRAMVGYDSAEQAIQDALAQGWTSLHELFVNQERLDELQALDRAGQLPLRVYAYLPLDSPQGDLYGDWYSAYHPRQVLTPHVTIAGLKIFLDGGWGRLPPYFAQDQLNEMVTTVHNQGWQIAVHSVGEESTDEIMNAFERALDGESNDKYRHRIEHLIFLRDDQIIRLKQLGINASIQLVGPPEWPPDPRFQRLIPLYGEQSVTRWKELLAAGVRTMGNSDAPWMTTGRLNGWNGSPLHLISTAVTRVEYPGETPPDYILAQTITVEQALRLLTIEGAYATFEENVKGSLAAGKLADLVVLSDNPLTTPVDQFPDIRTLMTMIGGRVEYCMPAEAALCP